VQIFEMQTCEELAFRRPQSRLPSLKEHDWTKLALKVPAITVTQSATEMDFPTGNNFVA